MKKRKRKHISVEKRDLWDGPHDYLLYELPVDKLKHMQQHISKRDIRLREFFSNIGGVEGNREKKEEKNQKKLLPSNE